MKDTVLYPENVAKYGILNFVFETGDLPLLPMPSAPSAMPWRVSLEVHRPGVMDVGYEGILSIENEDPILSGKWAWNALRTF